MEITVHGATIIVDPEAGTLRPKTKKDGIIFGITWSPVDIYELQSQRAARDAAIEAANKAVGGEPALGWLWLGVDGRPRYLL